MKKFVFIMPIMAISLFTNCANTPIGDPKPLEDCSWDLISRVSKERKAEEWFKIGDTKTVTVNNQQHQVRIIGFDQDVNSKNGKIGITFEFANLISDKDGYSIATQWNDTNDGSTANHNYLDSSIRKALTNEGNGHILWARKGETAWSTEDDYKKTVLEMLPEELTKVLVAPKKIVQCYENGGWIDKPITNNKGDYDKLFLLSLEETGDNADRTRAYTYYQEPDESKLNLLRIKKQVKEKEVLVRSFTIPSDAGQIYQGAVSNYAGYNSKSDNTGGGYSWLRSPATDEDEGSDYALSVRDNGTIDYDYYVYRQAFGVAPAFCI